MKQKRIERCNWKRTAAAVADAVVAAGLECVCARTTICFVHASHIVFKSQRSSGTTSARNVWAELAGLFTRCLHSILPLAFVIPLVLAHMNNDNNNNNRTSTSADYRTVHNVNQHRPFLWVCQCVTARLTWARGWQTTFIITFDVSASNNFYAFAENDNLLHATYYIGPQSSGKKA